MELIRKRQTDVCLLFFVTNEQAYAQTLIRKRTREHLFAKKELHDTPGGVVGSYDIMTHPGALSSNFGRARKHEQLFV